MEKKYAYRLKPYEKWTTKQLKDELISLDELINIVGCYGRKDLVAMNKIEAELDRRGIEISRRITFN